MNKLNYIGAILLLFSFNSSLVKSSEQHNPYICEKDAFTYGLVSSNQVTPLALPYMDHDFIKQTGGKDKEEKFRRATGSIELLLLVSSAQQGKNIKGMNEIQKKQQARQEMVKYLNEIGKGSLKAQYDDPNLGYLDFDTLIEILDKVKPKIQNHQPKENCAVQ